MSPLKAKLHSQRGETLVELLASILVATLSVGLLLGSITASSKIDAKGKSMDQTFYEALTKAESRTTPVTGGGRQQVRLEEDARLIGTLPVSVYGDDGLYAYARKPAGGDTP